MTLFRGMWYSYRAVHYLWELRKGLLGRNSDSPGIFPGGGSTSELNIWTSDKHFTVYEDAKSHNSENEGI